MRYTRFYLFIFYDTDAMTFMQIIIKTFVITSNVLDVIFYMLFHLTVHHPIYQI